MKRQVNTLLYCMGQDSDEILQAQGVTEDELADYDRVVGKFDEYFQVRANPIYERARLSKRVQEPDETAEQYILALYALAENCGTSIQVIQKWYAELQAEQFADSLAGMMMKKDCFVAHNKQLTS